MSILLFWVGFIFVIIALVEKFNDIYFFNPDFLIGAGFAYLGIALWWDDKVKK